MIIKTSGATSDKVLKEELREALRGLVLEVVAEVVVEVLKSYGITPELAASNVHKSEGEHWL